MDRCGVCRGSEMSRWEAEPGGEPGVLAIRRAMRELGCASMRLVVARRPLERLLGLIGTSPRNGSEGDRIVMAFPRCSAVHTCFMRRPLDIAFISEEGEVLSVRCRVKPWRFISCPGAWAALERCSRS